MYPPCFLRSADAAGPSPASLSPRFVGRAVASPGTGSASFLAVTSSMNKSTMPILSHVGDLERGIPARHPHRRHRQVDPDDGAVLPDVGLLQ